MSCVIEKFCTGTVVTTKVAIVLPPGTVTALGTLAVGGFPLASVTTIPPAGAGQFRVTVPVDELPPTTLVGARLTELTAGPITPVALHVAPQSVLLKTADSVAA